MNMQLIIKIASVVLSSSVKFIAGPLLGKVYGFDWWLTALCTFAGMMLAVVLFSTVARAFFFKYLNKFFVKKKSKITPGKRRIVKIWMLFGLKGLAFFSPILLTPIGGSVLAVSFGEKPLRIIAYMTMSAAFWAVLISWVIYFIPLPSF
jgi:hypothetical protein